MKYDISIDHRSYTILGKGDYPLLAFHGFSQDYLAFKELSQNAPELKIYCFKLFAHGFPLPENVTDSIQLKEAWLQAMEQWMEQQTWDKCGLVAFSMGNRSALQLLKHFPHKFDQATLLAPEGLSIHPVYWFSTRTHAGKRLFRSVTNPKLLRIAVKRLGQLLGWPLAITSLWMREIAEQPNRLFDAWQYYKGWEVLPQDLITYLPSDLPIHIWLAKNDVYVGEKNAKTLSRQHGASQIIRPRCTHFHLLNYYSRAYPKLPKSQQFLRQLGGQEDN